MNKKPYISAIFLLCFIITICGCSEKPGKKQAESLPVKVMEAKLTEIDRTLDYVGDIRADEEAIVYPKVTGKVIEKLKDDGDIVKKGDVIVYLDRDEVGFEFEKAPVEAFLDGFVGRVYVDIGTHVTPETPVALVVRMDTVEIRLNIPEKYIPHVNVGQKAKVTVDAFPDTVFEGTVTSMSPVLDADTRTARLKIKIDNKDHRLKSGMFARVSLAIESHREALVILKEAILSEKSSPYVYIVKDGIAAKRYVKLGLRKANYVEILEGVNAGDMVIMMGQQKVTDGCEVAASLDGSVNYKKR